MANYYFRNTGDSNWGTATNWSTSSGGPANGVVPTSADSVILDSNSGNCTVNTTDRSCLSLDTTSYTNTLNFSRNLNVYGNVSIGSSTILSGTYYLTMVSNATLTTSITIPNFGVGLIGSITVNVSSPTTVGNLLCKSTSAGASITLNGDITVSGTSFTVGDSVANVLSGNSLFTIVGNTTIQALAGSSITKNITIASSGTVTLSGNIKYSGNLVYTSGTVNASTCNLITSNNIVFSGDWSTCTFLGIEYSSAVTITLSSNFYVTNFVYPITGVSALNGLYNVYVSGGLSFSSTGYITGNATIVLSGSNVTWSSTGTSQLRNNLVINSPGNVNFSGNIYYGIGTLTYTSGNPVYSSGSTLVVTNSTTLNTSGMNWNNVIFSGNNQIFTLTSNFNVNGLLSLGNTLANDILTFNGQSVVANNGLLVNVGPGRYITGTSKIRVTGGMISQSGLGWMQPPIFEIDGNVTISSTASAPLYFFGTAAGTGTFSATGSISASGSNVLFNACKINTPGVNWNNVGIITGNSGVPAVLHSDLLVNGLLTLGWNLSNVPINNNGTTKTIVAGGGITFSSNSTSTNILGTANIKATGGTIYGARNLATVKNNFEIAGNVTFAPGTTFSYNTGTMSYTSGNVTTTNSWIRVVDSTTFNTTGVTWSNVYVETNTGVYFNLVSGSKFTVSDNLFLRGARYDTLSGTVINSPVTVRSTVSGTKAYLVHSANNYSKQNIAWTTATDIDSSEGLTIFAYSDVISGTSSSFVRTNNWKLLTPPSSTDSIMDFY